MQTGAVLQMSLTKLMACSGLASFFSLRNGDPLAPRRKSKSLRGLSLPAVHFPRLSSSILGSPLNNSVWTSLPSKKYLSQIPSASSPSACRRKVVSGY